ncbi:retropepsin-like aspartic protease family protein [Undibacterium fentianense]|uniref:retropepsin-like aspartic protease family protein n=1 Tax=Undibacterium fentianense TaxID=2828728 RepID=UPI001E29ECA7|nr:retropepsin-like aspartic protease [Undibacterium fentianense]
MKRTAFFGASLTLFLSSISSSSAIDLNLVALSNGKAMLIVDDKPPKMFAVGSQITPEIKLIGVNQNSAHVEINGKRQTLFLGHAVLQNNASKNASVTLQASENGHFFAEAKINGGSNLKVLVDTGASYLSMSAADAKRLGIDYKKGVPSRSSTANGIVPTYLVRLDSVKIGDIELFQVDASIHENEMGICLLGMSFLKRLSMTREGQQMVLTKKL